MVLLCALVIGAVGAVAVAFGGPSADAAAAPTGGYPYAAYQGPGSNPTKYTWTDARGQELSPYRYGYRNCTDFVAWKLDTTNHFRVPTTLGNANTWGTRVARGLVNGTPAPGAVAWSNAGAYGHVAWVESVNGSQLVVQDYNKAGTGQFSRRPASVKEFAGFIHFKDLATTPGGLPAGGFRASLDKADPAGNGRVHVTGWVIDTDTTAATQAHVYGGTGAPGGSNPGVALPASLTRNDVANAYKGYGARHGFDGYLQARVGKQTVCLYGINVAGTPGGNQQLICRTVTVR